MFNRVFLIPAAVALASSGAAFADGMGDPVIESAVPAPVPAPEPVAVWAGPSAGVQLSYGDISTEGPVLDGDGALLGVRGYYDWQTDNIVYGVGIQYDAGDIDLDGAAAVDGVFRLGGRVGVDLGQNWIYGTAGLARATTDPGTLDVGNSDGYFAGVGYEVYVAEATTLGAELLYHRFDDFDNVPTLEADATTLGVSVNMRF